MWFNIAMTSIRLSFVSVEINKNYSLTLPHRKSLCHGWPQPASFFQGRQRRESLGTRLWKLLVFWKLVVEERWPQLEVWLYLQDGRWFITTLSWSFKKATLSNSSTGDILCTIKITTQGTYLTIKFPWIACAPPPLPPLGLTLIGAWIANWFHWYLPVNADQQLIKKVITLFSFKLSVQYFTCKY